MYLYYQTLWLIPKSDKYSSFSYSTFIGSNKMKIKTRKNKEL